MCEHLNRLRELTPNLAPPIGFGALPIEYISDSAFKFLDETEGTTLEGLFKNEEIAVANAIMLKGTTMPFHFHEEKQIIIVYKGKLTVEFNNKKHKLTPGDVLVIKANIGHRITEVSEDCYNITITIPASKQYPNARK